VQLIRALLAQSSGLAVAALLAWLVPGWLGGGWRLVAVQAIAAAIASRALRQPAWWVPIHLGFLPAVVVAMTLQLPAGFYLAVFLLLTLVFWGTAKGDVPLFLSSREAGEAVARIAEKEHARHLIDLGAGIGSVVVPLARKFPGMTIEAWERAPLPWAITAWRCRRFPHVVVRRMSFWACDLSCYDIVYAFLSPAPMPELGDKIRREMRPGSLFVSSSFPVPGWQAEQVIRLADRRATVLYCYRIGGDAS
jgi:hypothetical protein